MILFLIRKISEVTLFINCLMFFGVFPVQIFADFSQQKASFSVKFKNLTSPYLIKSVFVLPGEILDFEIKESAKNWNYTINSSDGNIIPISLQKWQWKVPQETGIYPLKIIKHDKADSITLNIFVMIPYKDLKGEFLNGYQIGKYPNIPLKQLPIYKPPKGFIEVTKENEETLVSPHFKLKQFLCKQESGYPKYLVLQEKLLIKLEIILEKVNEQGYPASTFQIMSGYRTPYYNKLIGNVKYSRHLWGGGADIFIDENPEDGMMDDLNKDGIINYKDANIIYDIIDGFFGELFYRLFLGGLARYKKTLSHGPFVHVDVRGFRARWGD